MHRVAAARRRRRVLVAGSGGAEYDCGHPYGVDDRNLCLIFPAGVAAPPTVLLPVAGRIATLRRDLRRHLAAAKDSPDGPDDLDAIALVADGRRWLGRRSGRARCPRPRAGQAPARRCSTASSPTRHSTRSLPAPCSVSAAPG